MQGQNVESTGGGEAGGKILKEEELRSTGATVRWVQRERRMIREEKAGLSTYLHVEDEGCYRVKMSRLP